MSTRSVSSNGSRRDEGKDIYRRRPGRKRNACSCGVRRGKNEECANGTGHAFGGLKHGERGKREVTNSKIKTHLQTNTHTDRTQTLHKK